MGNHLKDLETIYENLASGVYDNPTLIQKLGELLFIAQTHISMLETTIEEFEERDALTDAQEEKHTQLTSVKEDLEALAESIASFGNVQPISVKAGNFNRLLVVFELYSDMLEVIRNQMSLQASVQPSNVERKPDWQIRKDRHDEMSRLGVQYRELISKLGGKIISTDIGYCFGERCVKHKVEFPSPVGVKEFEGRFGYFGAIDGRIALYQDAIEELGAVNKQASQAPVDPKEKAVDDLNEVINNLNAVIGDLQ